MPFRREEEEGGPFRWVAGAEGPQRSQGEAAVRRDLPAELIHPAQLRKVRVEQPLFYPEEQGREEEAPAVLLGAGKLHLEQVVLQQDRWLKGSGRSTGPSRLQGRTVH